MITRILPASLALFALLAASVAGCQTYEQIPSWIDSPPVDDEYLYAHGSFIGSLNPNDDEKNALTVAYGRLATALKSTVKATTGVRDVGSERRGSGTSRVEAEVSIEKAEHLETWRDVDGRRGRKGTVWVLVRIDKPKG